MQLRLLRLFLVFAALGWGVSVVGVFASWPQVNAIAQGMGAKLIAYVATGHPHLPLCNTQQDYSPQREDITLHVS